MIRFYFFLFIFIQACSPIGGLLNVNGSDSKANNYWWMVLLQGDNNLSAPIENSIPSNEDIAEENVLYENADVPWTLLVGAPNTSTGGAGLAIDSNGFIYVVGDTTAGIYSENPIGTKDMILAKYNSRKQIIWSKQIGIRGVHLDAADVGVDARGNVYVVASNSIGLGNKSLFAFKFDRNGREIWRRQTYQGGRNNTVNPEKIFVDSAGTTYIVGTSSAPARNFQIDRSDGFLIKIDTQGNWGNISYISIPGEALIAASGIAVSENTGDVFVIGTANANIRTNTTPSIGEYDLFVLKYDRNGNRQLFAQLGQDLSRTAGNSVALDSLGNVFVGGKSNANFDREGEAGNSSRGILVKYDPLGARQWIRYLGPSDGHRTTAVTTLITDAEDNIFTTGKSNHMLDGRQNVIGMDLFLTKHDSLGNVEWTRQIGIQGVMVIGKGIGRDLQGNLYCTGWTDGPIDEIEHQGNRDLFLLKFQ
ncbi:hypothetical protein B2G51_13305 [Leptospira santarosai]|nr:hypothetical protein B2G51_13305 [Leptospira santarosai]